MAQKASFREGLEALFCAVESIARARGALSQRRCNQLQQRSNCHARWLLRRNSCPYSCVS